MATARTGSTGEIREPLADGAVAGPLFLLVMDIHEVLDYASHLAQSRTRSVSVRRPNPGESPVWPLGPANPGSEQDYANGTGY